MGITLESCAFDVLSMNEILIGTKAGKLYTLTLDIDISNAVRRLQLRYVLGTRFVKLFQAELSPLV